MTLTKTALIVAGGKGERMNAHIPKQFLEIQGKPVLMHTLEAFHRFDTAIRIILVLPANQFVTWERLCKKHAFGVPHEIAAGGATRFDSVKNGLQAVQPPALIAVHDGVRPLVSADTIDRCYAAAAMHGAAIPVMEPVDSIRQLTADGSQSVDRSAFRLVQTPQVFDAALLKKAYEQEYSPLFTDDASVAENTGIKINLVEGNRENIKITTAQDLALAEILLVKMIL